MVFVFLVFCVQLSCYRFVQDNRLLEVSQPIDGAAIDDLAALVGRLASVNCHLSALSAAATTESVAFGRPFSAAHRTLGDNRSLSTAYRLSPVSDGRQPHGSGRAGDTGPCAALAYPNHVVSSVADLFCYCCLVSIYCLFLCLSHSSVVSLFLLFSCCSFSILYSAFFYLFLFCLCFVHFFRLFLCVSCVYSSIS